MYWALLAWQPPFAASGHASVQNLTLTRGFFFLYLLHPPGGQVRVQFLRIIISFQSGTESID